MLKAHLSDEDGWYSSGPADSPRVASRAPTAGEQSESDVSDWDEEFGLSSHEREAHPLMHMRELFYGLVSNEEESSEGKVPHRLLLQEPLLANMHVVRYPKPSLLAARSALIRLGER